MGVDQADQQDGQRDITENDALRSALLVLHAAQPAERQSHPLWRDIVNALRLKARRDRRGWTRRSEEFVSAYLLGAYICIAEHLDDLLTAESPWGVLCTAARREARQAVLASRCGGVVWTDETGHKVPANVTCVPFDLNEHDRPGDGGDAA